jgi:alpha-1,2-mannosyltransferase
MVCQSVASVVVGAEALVRCLPDVLVDSTGLPFVYPLAALAGVEVACYTHYPTISTDMLAAVAARRAQYNNAAAVSRSAALTAAKVAYYRAFAHLYGAAGRCASVVMVNSSWTREHIVALWGRAESVHLLYPPCDTDQLAAIPLAPAGGREKMVLSIAQFRPEKDHRKQIAAFHRFVGTCGADRGEYRLVLAGGCRSAEDRERVDALRRFAEEDLRLGSGAVEFRTNVPYSDILDLLRRATVGIHTMWNEHFGIGVVEYMAAGVVAVAHNSGGPRIDIVGPAEMGRGFLAESVEEYAAALAAAFAMSAADRLAMQRRARDHVTARFSAQAFEAGFLRAMAPLLLGDAG